MLSSFQLKQVILDQRESRKLTDNVPRQQFARLKELVTTPFIVIIMGIRRCGKSTLMQQIRATQPERDFCLSFEDDRLVSFSIENFQMLLEVFIELFGEQKTVYFDEIQNVEGWELFIRRLHEYGYKIYITGSNANLLSKELGTRLTGRYVTIELYPYSFPEYCAARKYNPSPQKQATTKKALHKKWLNEYQEEGGFPEYLQNTVPDYLRTLYESILYRDIIKRYNLPNEKPIKELVTFLASNIGKTVTYNSLSKTLGLASGTTTSEYCTYLENCYMFFLVHRYDHSLKKQLHSPKKAYMIDTALARVLGFRTSNDTGRFLENMVFIELRRRNDGNIYYHQGKHECDFVIREGNHIVQAIQVTQSLQNPETREREFNGLHDAMDAYNLNSGVILTENEEGEENGIKIIPIANWLLT